MTGVLIGRNLGRHAWREDQETHRERTAIYKPRREASEETSLANTLISDSQLPEL